MNRDKYKIDRNILLPQEFEVKAYLSLEKEVQELKLARYSPELDLTYFNEIDLEKYKPGIAEKYHVDPSAFVYYVVLHETLHRLFSSTNLGIVLRYLKRNNILRFLESFDVIKGKKPNPKDYETLDFLRNEMIKCLLLMNALTNRSKPIQEACCYLLLEELETKNKETKRFYKDISDTGYKELNQETKFWIKKFKWILSNWGIDFLLQTISIAFDIPTIVNVENALNEKFELEWEYDPSERLKFITSILESKLLRSPEELFLKLKELGLPIQRIIPDQKVEGFNFIEDWYLLGAYDVGIDIQQKIKGLLEGSLSYEEVIHACMSLITVSEVRNLFYWIGRGTIQREKGERALYWQVRDDIDFLTGRFFYLRVLSKLETQFLLGEEISCLERKFSFCFSKVKKRKGKWTDYTKQNCHNCRYYKFVKLTRKLSELVQ